MSTFCLVFVPESQLRGCRFWVSDEYGPYVYRFDGTGALIQAIQPPDAIIPLNSGDPDFTSEDDPDTGRSGNQGKWHPTGADFSSVMNTDTHRLRESHCRRVHNYTLDHASIRTYSRWRRLQVHFEIHAASCL